MPGSPFKCEITEAEATGIVGHLLAQENQQPTAYGDGLKEVVLGAPAFFDIDTHGRDIGLVDVKITGVAGKIVNNHIARLASGIYRVQYEPEVVGSYRVEIAHRGQPITDQPFYVQVTDPASVRIAEVHEAYAGKESYFIRKLYNDFFTLFELDNKSNFVCYRTLRKFKLDVFAVDTSEAGRGTLHVALRAANQSVKHNVQNLGNDLLKVVYLPKLPIPHRVDLRYSGVHAAGNGPIVDVTSAFINDL